MGEIKSGHVLSVNSETNERSDGVEPVKRGEDGSRIWEIPLRKGLSFEVPDMQLSGSGPERGQGGELCSSFTGADVSRGRVLERFVGSTASGQKRRYWMSGGHISSQTERVKERFKVKYQRVESAREADN